MKISKEQIDALNAVITLETRKGRRSTEQLSQECFYPRVPQRTCTYGNG